MTIPFCTERNPWKCSAIRFSSIILAASLLIIFPNALTAFVTYPAANAVVNRDTITMHDPRPMPMLPQQQCRMSKNDYIDNNYGDPEADEEEDDDEDDPLEPVFAADVRGRPSGVVMEDLEWRLERLRLEEANTRRFLKSKPRFLPYQECQKWVQAWGERWTSAEEWNEWIAAGEKRNSYVPSKPDEYYTRTGDWVSWDDFLGVEPKDDKSNND